MRSCYIAFLIISSLFLGHILSPCLAANRLALVIGNANYQVAPLKNPVNDATDMAAVLKQCGFDVTLKINSDHRTLERSIRDFGKKLKKGGFGLFYYAGHGIQVNRRNHAYPVDTYNPKR